MTKNDLIVKITQSEITPEQAQQINAFIDGKTRLEQLLKVSEYAAKTRVCVKTVRRHMRAGKIDFVRVNGKIRIPVPV